MSFDGAATFLIYYNLAICDLQRGIRIKVIPQSSKLKLGVRFPYTATTR